MIAKVIQGSRPYGCIFYVIQKARSEIIFSNDVRTDTVLNAANDFESVQKLKHKVKNSTIHVSINFAYEDTPNMDNQKMEKIGRRFIEKMGLTEHQAICVRHNDAKHSHFHLIINRIDWSGKVYSDSFIKNRAAKVCDELEIEFGLTVARGHGETINHKWNEKNLLKDEIRKAVDEGLLKGVSNFKELGAHLRPYGIELKIQYHKNGTVNGLSFRKGEIAMKGSAVDKRFSYKRIAKQISANKGTSIPTTRLILNSAKQLSRDFQEINKEYADGVIHIEKLFKLNKSKYHER